MGNLVAGDCDQQVKDGIIHGGNVLLTRDADAPVHVYHCSVHGPQDDVLMCDAHARCVECGRPMTMKEQDNG